MTTPYQGVDPSTIEGRNCAGTDGEDWFPTRTADIDTATALCDGCPALVACLKWALAHEQGQGERHRYGIFGGTTPEQRARMGAAKGEPRRRAQARAGHGSEGGYKRHVRAGEPICSACRAANSRAARARRERAAS